MSDIATISAHPRTRFYRRMQSLVEGLVTGNACFTGLTVQTEATGADTVTPMVSIAIIEAESPARRNFVWRLVCQVSLIEDRTEMVETISAHSRTKHEERDALLSALIYDTNADTGTIADRLNAESDAEAFHAFRVHGFTSAVEPSNENYLVTHYGFSVFCASVDDD